MSDPKMSVPKYGRKQFEQGFNIQKFTSEFLDQNSSRRLLPTREEVDLHWSWQVMRAYPESDNQMRIFLLEQKTCPLVEIIWEKKANEEAFQQKRAEQRESGFHIGRKTMALEYKKYPFAVIMTHTLHGDVNVPNILRLPLHRIKFLDLMRSILTANPTKDLTMHVLRELWGAVLTKVYDYEFGWRKDKKNEAEATSYQKYYEIVAEIAQARKRKHSEVEDVSDDSDTPLARTKAKKSANAAEDAEASGSLNAKSSRTTATGRSKASEGLQTTVDSVNRDVPSSTSRVKTPAIIVQDDERGHRTSGTSGVPTGRTASKPAHIPSQPLLGRKARLDTDKSATSVPPSTQPSKPAPSRAPWPYNPETGEKTNNRGPYRMSDREERMVNNGIPPWRYDPSTGAKTKITTGHLKGKHYFHHGEDETF